ncbi:MAG TPA: beta-ketoacyl synthase N-terminal-like domain-containing protein, partial [Thermoanaerobaculia bacterium]
MGERAEGPARAAVVTSLGAVTAFGAGVEAFWRGALAGRSGIAPVTRFSTDPYRSCVAAEIPAGSLVRETDELETGATSATRLAFASAREALADSPFPDAMERFGLVVGTSMGENGPFIDWVRSGTTPGIRPATATLFSVASALARHFHARGPTLTVSVACASGTLAVGIGADLIRRGECDAVLAGGFDVLSEFVFAGFDSLRALSPSASRPFDRRRD